MKSIISILAMTGLMACSAMIPEMFKTIDDIATDNAITVQVDKEAMKKDTDIHINVDVLNKDIPQEKSSAK